MDTWEDVQLICPNQCVCNQSPFMDLSIARWIQGLKLDKSTGSRREHKKSNEATDNENEVIFFFCSIFNLQSKIRRIIIFSRFFFFLDIFR